MDKLSKEQKDELATSLAALALYDGDVSFVFSRPGFCFVLGYEPVLAWWTMGVSGRWWRSLR